MKKIFKYASSREKMEVLRVLSDAFKDLNVTPEFTECIRCDESFSHARKKFDAYIFYGKDAEYFDPLINTAQKYIGKKTSRLKISFESLSSEDKNSGKKIFYNQQSEYFVLDENILLEKKEEIARYLKFIFYPPEFFFSYGNEKNASNELGDTARVVLEELEDCFRAIFPNIQPKSDHKFFEKGSLVDKNLKELADSEFIILLMNKKYLESNFCMKELNLVIDFIDKNHPVSRRIDKFNEKVFLITSSIADEYLDPHNTKKYHDLSDRWLSKLDDKVKDYIRRKEGKASSKVIKEYLDIIDNALPFIGEINNITRTDFNDLRSSEYVQLMIEINEKLENVGYKTFYSDMDDPELEIMKKTKLFSNIQNIDSVD